MTAWAYMIVFDEKFATRQQVQDFLDTIDQVTYWYACLPYCVFFTATITAQSLAQRFEEKFNPVSGQKFLICEVHQDRQGRLPRKAWHVFNNPDQPRLNEST